MVSGARAGVCVVVGVVDGAGASIGGWVTGAFKSVEALPKLVLRTENTPRFQEPPAAF